METDLHAIKKMSQKAKYSLKKMFVQAPEN